MAPNLKQDIANTRNLPICPSPVLIQVSFESFQQFVQHCDIVALCIGLRNDATIENKFMKKRCSPDESFESFSNFATLMYAAITKINT